MTVEVTRRGLIPISNETGGAVSPPLQLGCLLAPSVSLLLGNWPQTAFEQTAPAKSRSRQIDGKRPSLTCGFCSAVALGMREQG